MSKKASNFQKVAMSLLYRGKEIFKPLNTGRIDEHVSCIREWIANIFFYTRNGTTIMIDAGYNYDRLVRCRWWLQFYQCIGCGQCAGETVIGHAETAAA